MLPDGTDTVVKTASSALSAVEKLDSAMSALSLSDSGYFGASVSRDGDMLAVGAPYDKTAPANWGAIYLIKDGDDDGYFADASAADVTVINHTTAGITLGERDHFGSAVSLRGGILAVGAYYADYIPADYNPNTGVGAKPASGAVYIISAGTDNSFKTIVADDVVRIDATVTGLGLEAGDYFGGSVSLGDGVLLVGAPGDDTGGTNRGAVYLINDSDSDGDFSDATADDIVEINGSTTGLTLTNFNRFGDSVTLADSTMVVGAPGDGTGGTNRGAVYLIKDGGDGWATIETEDVTKISGSTAGITLADWDNFGRSVAVGYATNDSAQGSTREKFLAIGAFGDDTGGRERGAVYLINAGTSGDWSSITGDDVAKLHGGTDGDFTLANDDYFGRSVSLDGGTLIIGAYGDDTGDDNRGSVHAYNYTYNNTYRAALATTDFEKDNTPTDDTALGVGTITVTVSATDTAGNTGTDTESFVYDITAPTVTSVVYKDAATGGNDLTAVTGANKDIYSIISFSEELAEHEATDSTARPVIVHRVGSGGTEVQYDIVSHSATLQTGDCSAPGTGANKNKVYTCRYTTPTTIVTGRLQNLRHHLRRPHRQPRHPPTIHHQQRQSNHQQHLNIHSTPAHR